MKWFSHLASIAILVIASAASTAFAQTTGNGPYYATPSWDQTLPSSTRFIVLSNFNSEAVLDRETGLVWSRSPNGADRWFFATGKCIGLNIGGRGGWRLPTINEIASVWDLSATSGPPFPPGHPFTGFDPQSGEFWSATLSAGGGGHRIAVYGRNPSTGVFEVAFGPTSQD